MILECENCEQRCYETQLVFDSGCEAYECPKCGSCFFAIITIDRETEAKENED